MTSKNLLVRSGNAPGLLSNTSIVVFKTLLQDLEIESVANICYGVCKIGKSAVTTLSRVGD
jgi:hypothetical protein